MIKWAEDEGKDFMAIPVEECVTAALRDLGHENNTFGPIKHEFCGQAMGTTLRYLPMQNLK